jgi:hypothetical protein
MVTLNLPVPTYPGVLAFRDPRTGPRSDSRADPRTGRCQASRPNRPAT